LEFLRLSAALLMAAQTSRPAQSVTYLETEIRLKVLPDANIVELPASDNADGD